MKKLNIIAISTFLFLMFSLTSCQKKWIDPSMNQNPDAITDAPVATLLPAIETNMGFALGGNDAVGITSMWVQYSFGTSNQAAIMGGYNIKPADMTNFWASMYSQAGMMGTKIMMQKASVDQAPIYEGISKVLMAIYLGNATDLWGDVPYSEAFQGASNLQPKYDKSQDLYDTIQGMLTSAISYLQQTPSGTDASLSSSDYFFKGDASAWLKVAWALKARYTLHLSNVNTSWASDVISIIESAPLMSSNSDNMALYFGTSPTANNPIYMYEQQRAGYIANNSGFFTMLAADNSDPRSLIYKEPSGTSEYAGLYYGQKASPTVFMTYAEEMFIAAEAYHAAGDYANAKAYLVKGMTASIDMFKGLDATYDTTADAWLAAKVATYTGTANSPSLQEILDQKYAALYMQTEAYNDYRRTGYPNLTPLNSAGIPDRYPYSQDELNYNKNTPANNIYTKLFWAK